MVHLDASHLMENQLARCLGLDKYADIMEKIENELTYPGQIKVTLIREVRVQELAQ